MLNNEYVYLENQRSPDKGTIRQERQITMVQRSWFHLGCQGSTTPQEGGLVVKTVQVAASCKEIHSLSFFPFPSPMRLFITTWPSDLSAITEGSTGTDVLCLCDSDGWHVPLFPNLLNCRNNWI